MQIKVPYMRVYFEDLGHYYEGFLFFVCDTWRPTSYHVLSPRTSTFTVNLSKP